MARPRISQEKLDRILSINNKDIDLDSHDLALTLKNFGADYLKGLIDVKTVGYANGKVYVKLPVFAYFVRLLCEDAYDETVKCTITLDDDLTITTTYPSIRDNEKTALLISVAAYAGFKASRDGDILTFKTKIHTASVLHIYAISSDDIMDMLVSVYNM